MNKTSSEKQAMENRNKIINKSPKERYMCYNDVIGRGTYKLVYRGYDTHTGIEVAWNLIHFDVLDENEQNLIIDEVKLLEKLSSQNDYIIQFYNAWIDKQCGDLVVITELAMSGTLKEYIRKITNLKLRVIKKWCKQILDGINFLHQQNIVHRDLKCNNIFINSNTGNIIIGDLGLAKRIRTNLHSVIGTPEYMAPEMFDGEYTEKVDIYAFGMCLIEMITKKIPYSECPGVGSVYKKISEGKQPEQLDLIKNSEIRQIIEQCIKFNPNDRPTANELLMNPFFQVIKDSDNDDTLNLCGQQSVPIIIPQSPCLGNFSSSTGSCGSCNSSNSSNFGSLGSLGNKGNIQSPVQNQDLKKEVTVANTSDSTEGSDNTCIASNHILDQLDNVQGLAIGDSDDNVFAINSYEQTDKVDKIEQYMVLNMKKSVKLEKHNTSIIRTEQSESESEQ